MQNCVSTRAVSQCGQHPTCSRARPGSPGGLHIHFTGAGQAGLLEDRGPVGTSLTAWSPTSEAFHLGLFPTPSFAFAFLPAPHPSSASNKTKESNFWAIKQEEKLEIGLFLKEKSGRSAITPIVTAARLISLIRLRLPEPASPSPGPFLPAQTWKHRQGLLFIGSARHPPLPGLPVLLRAPGARATLKSLSQRGGGQRWRRRFLLLLVLDGCPPLRVSVETASCPGSCPALWASLAPGPSEPLFFLPGDTYL